MERRLLRFDFIGLVPASSNAVHAPFPLELVAKLG